jgi:hypothetical protein
MRPILQLSSTGDFLKIEAPGSTEDELTDRLALTRSPAAPGAFMNR